GQIVLVRRGGYVSERQLRWSSPEAAYALRARAVLASRPAGEALSHHASLAVRGIPVFGVDLRCVDLVGQVSRTMLAGIARVRPLGELEVVLVGDARCTIVADALVQVALASGPSAGVISADYALNRALVSLDDLAAAAERRRPVRASRRLSRFLASLDPACESVGESRTRLILAGAGLPVRSQVVITTPDGEFIARADLLVGEKVVIEFDGALKYAHDPSGAALFAEKRREDAIRALGYVVVRITWADLASPARLLARVHAACAAVD
ncbi:MAG: hypothetical protein WAR57_04665, partial [Candidatus Phosphoribacter sp.]